MKMVETYSSYKLLLISLLSAIFIVYPNIAFLPWELSFMDEGKHARHLLFFFIRYFFFIVLIWFLLIYNLRKIQEISFMKRLAKTFLITGVAYLIFVPILYLHQKSIHGAGSILLFQFFVVLIVCTFAGHVFMMYNVQLKKEQEIEQLKVENLKSRYDALTNQINPHFFFNSLNGVAALIRKKNDEKTLAYVNKLSDVFRYILQSDKRGLVTLAEELEFVQAFRYMMEVRFATKLTFSIDVAEETQEFSPKNPSTLQEGGYLFG